MHFANHSRKSSTAPPFPRGAKLPGLRRSQLKVIAIAGIVFLTLLYLLTKPNGRHTPYKQHTPSGHPPVVLLTVLDEAKYSKTYLDEIKENRIQYAEKHGYKTLFAKVGDYDLKNAPPSWTSVVAARHALTTFPDCKYLWFLDQNAFIMNPKLSVEEHVMNPGLLDTEMIKDFPIVPPDSIIKTFVHLRGRDVEFVLTQDKDGLSSASWVVKNGDWARFLLETWFDPLYRSYNFQKAETHALEHIVQWHPTILAKLALVGQRTINSYSKGDDGTVYQPGDFAIRFAGCSSPEDCEKEAEPYQAQWRQAFQSS